jgi:hypothetical protein
MGLLDVITQGNPPKSKMPALWRPCIGNLSRPFFITTSKGLVVFSYTEGKFSMKKSNL